MRRGVIWPRNGFSLTKRAPGPRSKRYSVLNAPHIETVDVTCGSNGHVTLNIYNYAPNSTSRPIIIYITPQTDSFSNPTPSVPKVFHSHAVVQIHPRWSPPHQFPTPIHDTLFAYTWILSNLFPSASPTSPSRYVRARQQSRPLAVYSTALGTPLATSLALTECRPLLNQPSISALAIQSGIFDWSGIVSTPPPAPPASDPPASAQDLRLLYSQRSKLFRQPAQAFDAFASPLLFFRSSGLVIPQSFPPSLTSLSPSPAPSSASEEPPQDVPAKPTRKAHLVFPPRKSGLRIPLTRIAVAAPRDASDCERGEGAGAGTGAEMELDAKGKGMSRSRGKGRGKGKATGVEDRKEEAGGVGVLRAQAEEMVKLMRRSVLLHEGKERRARHEGFDAQEEAERRVRLVEVGREDDGEWAAEFFEDVLGVE